MRLAKSLSDHRLTSIWIAVGSPTRRMFSRATGSCIGSIHSSHGLISRGLPRPRVRAGERRAAFERFAFLSSATLRSGRLSEPAERLGGATPKVADQPVDSRSLWA